MSAAVFVVRLVLGALLVAAGGLKVGHPADFAAQIASFRLLPPAVVGPIALGLPYVEVLLGGYLGLGLFTRSAAALAAAMFAGYAGVIASVVIRHIPAACGCFGPNDSAQADWPHVAFDAVLALAALAIVYRPPGALALDRKLRRT